MSALELLGIAIAGGLGATVRFLVGVLAGERPVRATVAVNLAASLIAGFCASLLPLDETWRAILVTGFCGGLSTYSAFATQAVQQLERRRAGHAFATIAVTLVGGALAAAVGLLLGAMLVPAVAI
ncbi:camphor resistance protein CrcB [Agrococcus baldri]|uniref:Fluoride-specific ion channel FluC n=1 Tax=Agrococcus baldri TaxID=153730 RepID=A0AA94HLL0_9MICO|nr:CrcB family protein [Agrococcus baldri]SFS08016.1 camphor resistance protein CrcB [Agrococcus baldri]